MLVRAGRVHRQSMQYFFEPDHLAVLTLTTLAAAILCVATRRRPGRWVRIVALILGPLIAVNEVWYFAQLAISGHFNPKYTLPLYLCDVGAVVAGAALVWRKPLLIEVTYFWAFAGTLQGLLTPDMHPPFLSYMFLEYYIDHAGVVVAACFLVFGLRQQPRPGAVRHVFGITAAFTLLVGLVDIVTGGDYMYLRNAPGAGSLLDYFGPWPWYIVVTTVLAYAVFTLLDIPFRTRPNGATSPLPSR